MKSIQVDNQFNDFKELGINLNKDMAKIDAKIIPAPTLLLGQQEGKPKEDKFRHSIDKGRETNF